MADAVLDDMGLGSGSHGHYAYAQLAASGLLDDDKTVPWMAQPGIGGGALGTKGFQLQMGTAAVSAYSDVVNAQDQAAALRTRAAYTKFESLENLKRGNMQADQAKKVSDTQVNAVGERANQVIGAQRAGYAAEGVKVNTGSALDEQVATGKMAAIDAMTIRNNAALKVWGIQTGAKAVASQQEFQAMAEESEAKQSLALGGAKAANQVMQQLDTYESMKMRGW